MLILYRYTFFEFNKTIETAAKRLADLLAEPVCSETLLPCLCSHSIYTLNINIKEKQVS